MEAQTFEYRGYKIVVTEAPPFWEAAIHPSHPSLPKVDWTHAPIRGHNEKVVEGEAQRRINSAQPWNERAGMRTADVCSRENEPVTRRPSGHGGWARCRSPWTSRGCLSCSRRTTVESNEA